MKRNPVGWFEIYVSDLQRAKKFYEAVLQIELDKMGEESNFEMYAFRGNPEAGGASGALCKMPGFEPGKNSVLIYFSCADCQTESGRVEKAGGKVQKPKTSIGPYGFMSLVVDTEGNMIGLHSMA